MYIKTKPKQIFGSQETFEILDLLYDKYGNKFFKEEFKILFEVSNLQAEKERFIDNFEEIEYEIVEKYLKEDSISVSFNEEHRGVFVLEVPHLKDSEFKFREYKDFEIWFRKLDNEHLITEYNFPCTYGHIEYFVFKNKLYKIHHCLDYDLVDDYPYIAFESLTEIVRKDSLIDYLIYLKKRHGEPIYVDNFYNKEYRKIQLLDYLYPDIGGEKLFNFMKTNIQLFFDENEKLNIDDLIRFLYISEKLSKEV
jgi:hypothetical protein